VQYEALVHTVAHALERPLPGIAAQQRMAPRPRREWPAGFDRGAIRDAAGLLLFFPIDDRAHIVLTVRAHTLGRHGGQVSMPGGVIDPGETIEGAALREAEEEIGVSRAGIRTFGALTPIEIPVSGFRLHPVVAATDARPHFTPAAGEVARVLEIDVDELMDPRALTTREAERDGTAIVLPAFALHGVEVWGATAMVLAEFLHLLTDAI
jgi:8-oxo-dGTP pyrophosphatase MutT (NUDIX family)